MSSNTSGSSAALSVLKAITWLVYAFAVAAIGVLAFAFVLLLFGASTDASFSKLIYDTATMFMRPFVGMIEPITLSNGGLVSWSALIAIAAYAVAAAIVGSLLGYVSRKLNTSRSADAAAAPAPAAAPQPAAPAPVAPQPAAPQPPQQTPPTGGTEPPSQT